MRQRERSYRSYKGLVVITRIFVLVQLIIFVSAFVSLLKKGDSNTLTITFGILSLVHAIFGVRLMYVYNQIFRDDKFISILTIIESFIFGSIPGLVLMIIARLRQKEGIEKGLVPDTRKKKNI